MRHECKAKQEEESETLEETTGSGSGGTETESIQPTEGILSETDVEGSGNEIKKQIIRTSNEGATDTDAVESVGDRRKERLARRTTATPEIPINNIELAQASGLLRPQFRDGGLRQGNVIEITRTVRGTGRRRVLTQSLFPNISELQLGTRASP